MGYRVMSVRDKVTGIMGKVKSKVIGTQPYSKYERNIYNGTTQNIYSLKQKASKSGWVNNWNINMCGVPMVNNLQYYKLIKWGVPVLLLQNEQKSLAEFSNWMKIVCDTFGIEFSEPEIVELTPDNFGNAPTLFSKHFDASLSMNLINMRVMSNFFPVIFLYLAELHNIPSY